MIAMTRLVPCLALVALLSGCPSAGAPAASDDPFPIARDLVDCGEVSEADCAGAVVAAMAEANYRAADVRSATLQAEEFPEYPGETFVMILELGDGSAVNVAMMREVPSGPIVPGLPEP